MFLTQNNSSVNSSEARMTFFHERRLGLLIAMSVAGFFVQAAEFDPAKLPPAAARKVNFTTDVKPILESRCYDCHGPKKQESGLRWDKKSAAIKGGDSGPAIVPGKGAESLLV